MRRLFAIVVLGLFVSCGNALADNYLWCWDEDVIEAEVVGSQVVVSHNAAVYNCCWYAFQYDLSWDGDQLVVTENEVLTSPCWCLCCYDLSVTLEDLPTGELDILFRWLNEENHQWREELLTVIVPPADTESDNTLAKSRAAVSDIWHSECLSAVAAVPDEPVGDEPTWGTIKAWYR